MALEQRLESLKARHSKIEFAIANENNHPFPDENAIKKLKIEKLALKDQISELIEA